MAVRKIAISVPEDVLNQVDRLAKRNGTTRSAFITRVLVHVSKARTEQEITSRINALFEEPETRDEQLETSHAFLRAAEKSVSEDPEW